MRKKVILTGDRPTGPLHLGHYVGSHKNRLLLSNTGNYHTYIMVADVQALTDNFDDPEKVKDNILQVVEDQLALGLTPDKLTYFLQSAIPQIAELTIFYANLVPMGRLSQNPTVKSEIKEKDKFKDSVNLGFFMYPVSQAADITIVKGELVPVGDDQLPMIEETREIVRKFNTVYRPIFPEPEGLVGDIKRLVGTDGNSKMSKSIGNCIYLKDSKEEVINKVKRMYTDPNRIHGDEPGTVEGNPVFIYHDAFNPNLEEVEDLKARYRQGNIKDVEVKEKLAKAINDFLEPVRENRSKLNRKKVKEILLEGTIEVQKVAQNTIDEVKDALKISLKDL